MSLIYGRSTNQISRIASAIDPIYSFQLTPHLFPVSLSAGNELDPQLKIDGMNEPYSHHPEFVQYLSQYSR
jgi:hypothetical protein